MGIILEEELIEEEIKDYMGYADPPEFNKKDRSRANRRKADLSHAIRRRAKDRALRGHSPSFTDWYDNLHEYSKGKIHCSCPMCRIKTNDKNALTSEPPVRDRRKIEKLNAEINFAL